MLYIIGWSRGLCEQMAGCCARGGGVSRSVARLRAGRRIGTFLVHLHLRHFVMWRIPKAPLDQICKIIHSMQTLVCKQECSAVSCICCRQGLFPNASGSLSNKHHLAFLQWRFPHRFELLDAHKRLLAVDEETRPFQRWYRRFFVTLRHFYSQGSKSPDKVPHCVRLQRGLYGAEFCCGKSVR